MLLSDRFECNIRLISRINIQVIAIFIFKFQKKFSASGLSVFYFLFPVSPGDQLSLKQAYLLFCEPIITLDTKLTMALAGCSGSCSANRWHILSMEVPVFLATKPKILRRWSKEFNSSTVICHNNWIDAILVGDMQKTTITDLLCWSAAVFFPPAISEQRIVSLV